MRSRFLEMTNLVLNPPPISAHRTYAHAPQALSDPSIIIIIIIIIIVIIIIIIIIIIYFVLAFSARLETVE